MICRFFAGELHRRRVVETCKTDTFAIAGLFGSAPLTLVAAVFADMFNNQYRGMAVALFAGMIIMGPLMAPFIVSLPFEHNILYHGADGNAGRVHCEVVLGMAMVW